MVNAVFVYGGLKLGYDLAAHPLLIQHRRAVRKGRVRGLLYDLGKYPGMVELRGSTGEETGWVYGEVHGFEEIPQVLTLLDQIEGYSPQDLAGSLYLRREVEVILEDGTPCRAWAYLYNRPVAGLRQLTSGQWPEPSRSKLETGNP